MPVVPVTLNGTRSLLGDGAWLAQRGMVHATIGETIPATGPGWDRALALRDAARKAMRTICTRAHLISEHLQDLP